MQVFTLINDSKFAHIQYVEDSFAVILRFKSAYVPSDTFKAVLREIEALPLRKKAEKIIFDKSNLTVFTSRAWSGTMLSGKKKMLRKGVKSHRKILPKDRLFRGKRRIGREKIAGNHPSFSFTRYDIQYFATALKKPL